ncbi:MAG: dipeptidase, partial [Caldilineaceae bacterium]
MSKERTPAATRRDSAPANLPRVIDGHNDTLLALALPRRGRRRGFFERSKYGHIDLPRAQEGGLGAGFFAIFVPNREPESSAPSIASMGTGVAWPLAKPLNRTYALNATLDMTAMLLRIEAESQGAVKLVRTIAELREVVAPGSGTLGAILHIEGAEPIDAEFTVLDVLVAAGLRSLGIVWSRPTIFAHGVPFAFPSTPDVGPGLTDLGRELVRRCNSHRIMIDLSHLNERGFWDVAELSRAPLVATHSGAHACCRSSRNLTDPQIKAIAQSGGVMGINFFP